MFSLSLDSVDKMNQVTEGSINAGSIEPVPVRDYKFMQQRTVEEPDGHTWELFYMDMTKFPQQ